MNWMDFILDILELCIWPFTLLTSLYLLRSPLSLLLPFTESIKYKDLELQFSHDLNLAREHAQQALPSYEHGFDRQSLLDNSQYLPNHSVLEAWAYLSMSTQKLLLDHFPDTEMPTQQTYKFVGQTLLDNKLFTEKQAKLFHELRQLRNKVAHASGFEISGVLARQYIDMCFAFNESLKASL